MRLRDTDSADGAPALGVSVESATILNSASPTWVFPVAAAGTKSYVIEAVQQTGTTLVAGGTTAQLAALFVPFGSTGTSGP